MFRSRLRRRPGDCSRDRARDDETEAGDGDRCRRCHQRTERCANSESKPATDARTLGGLGTFLELLARLCVAEVPLRVSSDMTTLISSSLYP